MTTHGVVPLQEATGPFVQASDELLHQSVRSRVFRRHLPNQPNSIICKELLGTNLTQWVQHEIKILERLDGISGVPRLAHTPAPTSTITFQDTDGVPLMQVRDALREDVSALLQFALDLTEIISAVHRRGILHKDINPANILITRERHTPVLIDFHLATIFAEAQPNFTHHNEILGTLAYLAPEQTGRTGRAVDSRADLYALGATLYELATGQPPFDDEDVLQLIHNHLARVPVRPSQRDPRLPKALSDIIMRLLEKEPDRRYQSAEGLAHDLRRLRDRHARGESGAFRLGQHDFPLRLLPPARLVGRAAEISELKKALKQSLQGKKSHTVLVSGAPGIGKTALINELRPIVTAQRGWFVSGKFDQYRHDAPSAIVQALRGLGRLLLAEPESELAPQRERIRAALGANVGLIAALLPEFALLLGQHEITNDDPLQYQLRMRQAGLALLRAIASPTRPVVMVIDDLQWASTLAIGSFDALLMDETLEGLLLVGAFRDGEVDALHPLSAMLTRWSTSHAPPLHLQLQNLPPSELGALLEEMLRLRPAQAAALADAVCARTCGNPYDTVELINALRQDGALMLTDDGWQWEAATIRRFVGKGDVVDLLALRIDRLPLETRSHLEIIACLGGTVKLGWLQVAGNQDAAALDAQLAPALEDGLLLIEQRGQELDGFAVRFRHDRVQQAVYGRLDPAARNALHLTVGRRLMAAPALASIAAEQYLTAIDLIEEPHERRSIARLFRQTAAHARSTAAYIVEERYLSAAMTLLRPEANRPADPDLIALKISWHSVLYSLARYDEADKLYAEIEGACDDLQELSKAACVQISSLVNRRRLKEAMALGVALLNRAGMAIPEGKSVAQNERGLKALSDWVHSDARKADLERPELTDPWLLSLAQLLNRTSGAAFYAGDSRLTWLLLRRHQMWIEHGPCAPLLKIFGTMPLVTMQRQDYRTGYIAIAHGMAVGEARRYDYDAAWLRHCFALFCQHWFEPLEHSVAQAQRAREGLLQGGDLQYACFSYHTELIAQLESAPTLDVFAAVLAEASIFSSRTGNAISNGIHIGYQQLLEALRGDSDLDASFAGNQPATNIHFHLVRAHAAAIFGDAAMLQRHLIAAMPLLPSITGFYTTALTQTFQALALAERARASSVEERAAILPEFDACRDWLALRADDAPGNFLHLLKWLDAERAWVSGDVSKAAALFDMALREVRSRKRPWHHALMTERAGLFYLESQLEHAGQSLLTDAQRLYQDWGALAKVRALQQKYVCLQSKSANGQRNPDQHHRKSTSSDTIDMLAVSRASQTLSSKTNFAQLHARVCDLVGALTGATTVRILLWRDDLQGWVLSSMEDDAVPVSIEQAGKRCMIPVSAFRYAVRTKVPLLVEDAIRDDRFARDPYFSTVDQCSLLVVPILVKGAPRAVLMMENRATRGAFSIDRLDAVMLIAGQLVS